MGQRGAETRIASELLEDESGEQGLTVHEQISRIPMPTHDSCESSASATSSRPNLQAARGDFTLKSNSASHAS